MAKVVAEHRLVHGNWSLGEMPGAGARRAILGGPSGGVGVQKEVGSHRASRQMESWKVS